MKCCMEVVKKEMKRDTLTKCHEIFGTSGPNMNPGKLQKDNCTYLFVELGKSGLKQLSDVGALMVGVLNMAQTLAHLGLLRQELLFDGARKSMKRHNLVLGISNCLKFHVRNLLVVNNSRVMGGHKAWEFREVRCHCIVSVDRTILCFVIRQVLISQSWY